MAYISENPVAGWASGWFDQGSGPVCLPLFLPLSRVSSALSLPFLVEGSDTRDSGSPSANCRARQRESICVPELLAEALNLGLVGQCWAQALFQRKAFTNW